jgi:hypothetical protein
MSAHVHDWRYSAKYGSRVEGRWQPSWECDTCFDIRDHDDVGVLSDIVAGALGQRMPIKILRRMSDVERAALVTSLVATGRLHIKRARARRRAST